MTATYATLKLAFFRLAELQLASPLVSTTLNALVGCFEGGDVVAVGVYTASSGVTFRIQRPMGHSTFFFALVFSAVVYL